VMLFVDKLIGLRVSEQSELMGLDRAEHNTTMTSQASSVSRRKALEISIWKRILVLCGGRGGSD
jgi:hypothetical protein